MARLSQFDEEFMEIFGDENTFQTIKEITETGLDEEEECQHDDYFEDEGISVCKYCGCEVNVLDFEPEWRYYGASDNRTSKDPSRCHRSKENSRGGIDKVFQDVRLNLQQSIKKKVELRYNSIVNGTTVRGKGRKGIVAACLLYVFRDEGDVRTADEVRALFGLTKQQMSDGLTRYHETFPADRTKHITPSQLVRRIMQLTGVELRHYQKILRIAKCLQDTDYTLNHSSPQSVASAIVYLYLCLHREYKTSLGLSKSSFAHKAGLSDITITKLVKVSAEILGYQELTM